MKTGNTDDTLEAGGGGLSEGGVSSSVVKGLLLPLSSACTMVMICSKRPSSSAHLFPQSNITRDWILNFADNWARARYHWLPSVYARAIKRYLHMT